MFLARLREIGAFPRQRMHSVTQAILGESEEVVNALRALEWEGTPRRVAVHLAPYLGRLLIDVGKHEAAEEFLRNQWECCREAGAVTYELNMLPPLIESYLRLDRREEARQYMYRTREILSKPEDWKGLAAGGALAEALLATVEERWEDAES